MKLHLVKLFLENKRKKAVLYSGILILGIILILASCARPGVEEYFVQLSNGKTLPVGIEIIYPRNGTIFPPEFPSPEFVWKDSLGSKSKWYLFISSSEGKKIYSELVLEPNWRPDSLTWSKIKSVSIRKSVYLTIINENRSFFSRKYSSGKVFFATSRDSVGASVFYRAVPLPFSYAVKNVNKIQWYLGRVDGGKPKRLLTDMVVCANCHSFPKDGSVLAMDVDYANDKGSYAIAPTHDTCHLTEDKVITWSDFKRQDGQRTFGLLSQISPNGKYVLSTVKDISIFVPVDTNLYYSQLFFPIKGIIAYYDREKRTYAELKGASDTAYVQSNPNWSPDNNEIMFARANKYESEKVKYAENVLLPTSAASEFLSGQKDFKFDLYRVPFNNGKGGEAEPVPGASKNGMSNYFARYSPDGKWIVFCQSMNFMLLRPDSRLYIMPAKGGAPRLMGCNMKEMNSWHSWSPNSKWLIFSSKNRGPYTQLYLTHIDDHGNDSPAVLAENLRIENRAANIPEFYPAKNTNFNKIVDNFSQTAVYYTKMATENSRNKAYKKAFENLAKAKQLNKNFFEAYYSEILLNSLLRQSNSKTDIEDEKKASELVEQQIRQSSNNEIVYLKRCDLRYLMGDNVGALQDALKVIGLNPKDFKGYEIACSIYRKTNQWEKAIPFYEKMIKLQPDDKKQTTFYLAEAYQKTGKIEESMGIMNKLIQDYPDEIDFHVARAMLFYEKNDVASAQSELDNAIADGPNQYEGYQKRGEYYLKIGDKVSAGKDFDKAANLLLSEYLKSPEDINLLFNRMEILDKTGRFSETIEDVDKILKLWPSNYAALKLKAKLALSSKNWQQAIETYNKLLDNYPAETEFYNNQAMSYLNMGNHLKGLEYLNKALKIDPSNCETLYNRAKLKSTLKDDFGAKNDLQRVITLLNGKKARGILKDEDQRLLSQVSNELKN